MSYLKPIAAIALTSVIAVSCSNVKRIKNPEYKTTPKGLEYMMVVDHRGDQTPDSGDYVELHIKTINHKDSVIFDSRKLQGGKPAQFQLKPASFNGDLAEGIMMLTAGDSAVFRVLADSLISAGQNLQGWMDTGKKITYTVKMVSVKTEEQLKQEKAAEEASIKVVDEKKLTEYFAKNNIKAQKTASGLYYKIVEPGTGAKPEKGQNVSVNYTGKTLDGNVFDSNVDPQFQHVEPLTFPVATGRVIKGWDEGLLLLNKGAKAVFYIPSYLAYGAQSPSPAIPANSVLIFDVELIDIK